MNVKRAQPYQKAPQKQELQKQAPQQRVFDEFSSLTFQDNMAGKELRQSAATALHNHSALLLHALFMNEA
jgi:hypothetical protein